MYFFLYLGAGTDTGWRDTGFPVGGGANWGGGEDGGGKLEITQILPKSAWN